MTVSSRRPSGPTGPKITSPVFMPTRRQRPQKSSALSTARPCISSAARTARVGSSSCATGAPKTAIRASPITLSTLPPKFSTTSPISCMQRSTIKRTSSGSVRSDNSVKPDRSANSTVAQRRSSSSCPISPAAAWSSVAPHPPQKLNPGGFSGRRLRIRVALECRSRRRTAGTGRAALRRRDILLSPTRSRLRQPWRRRGAAPGRSGRHLRPPLASLHRIGRRREASGGSVHMCGFVWGSCSRLARARSCNAVPALGRTLLSLPKSSRIAPDHTGPEFPTQTIH